MIPADRERVDVVVVPVPDAGEAGHDPHEVGQPWRFWRQPNPPLVPRGRHGLRTRELVARRRHAHDPQRAIHRAQHLHHRAALAPLCLDHEGSGRVERLQPAQLGDETRHLDLPAPSVEHVAPEHPVRLSPVAADDSHAVIRPRVLGRRRVGADDDRAGTTRQVPVHGLAEHLRSSRTWSALELRPPVVFADGRADTLQRRSVVPRRPERRTILRDSGQVDRLPGRRELLFRLLLRATDHVVGVPPLLADDRGAARFEPLKRNTREPVPRLVPDQTGFDLVAVFERVVNEQQIDPLAGQRSSSTRREEASALRRLPEAHGRGRVPEPWPTGLLRAQHDARALGDVPREPALALSDPCLVAGEGDDPLRVPPEQTDRGMQERHRLAVPRGRRDEPEHRVAHRCVEQVEQRRQVRRAHEQRRDVLDERAEVGATAQVRGARASSGANPQLGQVTRACRHRRARR